MSSRPAVAGLIGCLLLPLATAAQQRAADPGAPFQYTAGPQAAAELQQGLQDWWNWQATSGRDHMRKALELEPSFALARVALLDYDPRNAEAEIDRAVADAGGATAEEWLMVLAAREQQQGRTSRSAALLAAAAALNPGSELLALAAANRTRGAERLAHLRETAGRFPQSPLPRLWLAHYLTVAPGALPAANVKEATDALEEALRLAPDHAGAHIVLARVLRRTNRLAEAEQHVAQALAVAPDMSFAHAEHAQVASALKQYRAARVAMEKALELNPYPGQQSVYERARAMSLVRDRKLKEGIAALEASAQRAEQDGFTALAGWNHIFCGMVLGGMGDADALQHLQHARKLGVRENALTFDEALVNAMLGNAEAAQERLAAWLVAAREESDSARINGSRTIEGYIRLARGDAQGAVDSFTGAMAHPYAPIGLERAYRKLGRRTDAERVRAEYLARLDPGLTEATALPVALNLWK